MTSSERRHLRNGLLFASPWLIGLSAFVLYPIGASAYFSFCDYSTLQPPVWIGLDNYRELLADDVLYKSLYNTLFFAGLSLPLSLLVSLALAILLNTGVRGLPIFRTLFYLPALVPIVASAMLWLWIFNGQYGILNYFLQPVLDVVSATANHLIAFAGGEPAVRLVAPTWLASPTWAKPALVLMSLWGVGGSMVIYLAGIQDVPTELYEAAEIDGAGWWRRIWHVTLPRISPVIYFNLIIGIIAVLQTFTTVYIMTGGPDGGTHGHPLRSTLFYALYLYQQAFEFLRMGYASAMAWILFLVIAGLTILAHKTAGRLVTYSE
mgnify:CR=1 FL=1